MCLVAQSSGGRGRRDRGIAGRVLGAVVSPLVAPVVDSVDVDGVVQRIDLDELVERVDLDGVVDRVGFTGRGCAISQASASLLTDEIKGKPLSEVAALGADDLLDLLGIEISPARLKCAMLSHDSLQHVLEELGAKAASAPAEAASAPAEAGS